MVNRTNICTENDYASVYKHRVAAIQQRRAASRSGGLPNATLGLRAYG